MGIMGCTRSGIYFRIKDSQQACFHLVLAVYPRAMAEVSGLVLFDHLRDPTICQNVSRGKRGQSLPEHKRILAEY